MKNIWSYANYGGSDKILLDIIKYMISIMEK